MMEKLEVITWNPPNLIDNVGQPCHMTSPGLRDSHHVTGSRNCRPERVGVCLDLKFYF